MPLNLPVRACKNVGFTLIELLVVISVVGVLAAAVIAVINPAEQIARGKDAENKVKILQLGRAVEAYIIDRGTFPIEQTVSPSWMQQLVNGGEIRALVPAVTGNKTCTTNAQINNFCYDLVGTTAYVYTFVQSSAEAGKCTGGVGGASSNVYYVYDTSNGKSCLKCASNHLAACNATQ